jgi:aspartate/methionine/tyrosine aminotransferase
MTYLDAGDMALIPNPGYPTYSSAVRLAGGTTVPYELTEENNWFPDLEQLGKEVTALNQQSKGTVKLMWVNYPQMPTGKLPEASLFKQLVAFGKQHNILICHDNPYSFILNDEPTSLLSVEGAKDCVVELNSLSKSQNMAGWRVGTLCGAKERIDEVLRFKSNMDSGMFLPLQLAAATALGLPKEWYDQVNSIYRARRTKVFELLTLLNCVYDESQAGMFVWAKIPAGYKDGFALSDEVLYNANVFITPGGIFGNAGNPYVRVSLCSSEEKLQQSIDRVQHFLTTAKVTA